jgi:hypothetical protein
MKKIISYIVLILGLVSISTNHANAFTVFDQGNHKVSASTLGPVYTNGVLGNATIRTSVDVKYRVVRFEIIGLDQVFTQADEISFSINTLMPVSGLSAIPYLTSEAIRFAAFPPNQVPSFCANLSCTKIAAWTRGLQEETFGNDGAGNLSISGTVHPVPKDSLYTLGYVYDSTVSFTGSFIVGIVDIEGAEYSIAIPEIVEVDSSISDIDLDVIPDLQDNCLIVDNTLQEESDGDIYGDACDSIFDITNDSRVDFGDVITLLAFVNGAPYEAKYDVDLNGVVDFGDVITLLGHINEPIGPSGL